MGESGPEVREGGERPTQVLHIRNIAGFAGGLATAQRALGHDAIVWSQKGDSSLRFPSDDHIRFSDPIRWNLSMLARRSQIRDYDVVHIHGGIWRTQLAFRFLKNVKVVHYHGAETRTGKGLHHKDIADVVLYTPPDLQRWHPDGIWVPQPIDLPDTIGPPPPERDHVRFVHFKTGNERNKGTSKVVEMFQRAFGPLDVNVVSENLTTYMGNGAKLVVWQNIPRENVLEEINVSDVVFDQIADFGIYGFVSVEAMAHGRPTLATVNSNLYPEGCPVIFPRVSKLMELAKDKDGRLYYGELGRTYAEHVHAAPVVAQKVLDAYKNAMT